MKNRKYLFFLVIGVILIIGIVFYNMNILANPPYEDENNEGNNITLSIDYNNGTIKYIEDIQVVPENNTVFDVLLTYCTIEYTEYPGGAKFIDSIDGIENHDPNYWQYWVNEIYGPVGASQYHLDEEDDVEWIYGNS